MKIETILNAYIAAWTQYDWWENRSKHRQMKAFRARIIKMDAEKDEIIEEQSELIVTLCHR